MEVCPLKPGAGELLGMWWRGERTPMVWICVMGLALLAVLWATAILTLI
jgi:hypothetical protein